MDWLLELITGRIDANPDAEYLIDFIPNLKYMLRAKFLQENISEALEKFEEKVEVMYLVSVFTVVLNLLIEITSLFVICKLVFYFVSVGHLSA